jgi:hypothetical protein
MDLRALQEAGLYDPTDPGADERRELLQYLMEEEGCGIEEMQVAHARGRLFALAGDRRIRPVVGLLTLREAGARLETDPEHLLRVWRSFGLPDSGIDTPLLTDDDVEAFQTYVIVRSFLGEETALGVTRVVGSSLARITEAVSAAMRVGMDTIDVAVSGSEVVTARSYSQVTQLVPRFGKMLDVMHRQHLEATRVHFEGMDIGDRAAFRCGVGFADLSGFTHMSSHLALGELSQVLTFFEEAAAETVLNCGGRIVKFLGDAVMFVAANPGDLARIAADLVRHPRAAAAQIDVRAGIAYGRVLAQDGDYFGTPVNLASRLVSVAQPGEVLADDELVQALGTTWDSEAGEPLTLRGFQDEVTPYRLVLP